MAREKSITITLCGKSVEVQLLETRQLETFGLDGHGTRLAGGFGRTGGTVFVVFFLEGREIDGGIVGGG